MKRIFLLSCLFAVLSLSSCQCSNKPDIGPVEDPEEAALIVPETEHAMPSGRRV